MKIEPVITDEDVARADNFTNLGPMYFSARRFMEQFTKDCPDDFIKPLVTEASDKLYSELMQKCQDFIVSDIENNIHQYIRYGVEETIEAILKGTDWALDRYIKGSDYDCVAVRKAIFDQIGPELMDQRVKDLTEQNEALTKDLLDARRTRW